MAKLILIDGSSLLHRAFYALPLLSNSRGEYTNAVYGFINMLNKLLEGQKPDFLLVCFDKSRVTFRNQLAADYKGTRKETPLELRGQFELMKEALDAFSIRWFELENYEADDIIGAYASQGEQAGMEVCIYSGDRDVLQLVDAHTNVYLTKKGINILEKWDVAKVHESYGLSPDQLRDLKGLMGDSSDNISGVPGVGEKTALKLLAQFGRIEAIYEDLGAVENARLREKLAANQATALLSKDLATICREIPAGPRLEELAYQTPDAAKLLPLFQRLEFKSLLAWLKNLPAGASAATKIVDSEAPWPESESFTYLPLDEAALRQADFAKGFAFAFSYSGAAVDGNIQRIAVALPGGPVYCSAMAQPAQGELFPEREQSDLRPLLHMLGPLFADVAVAKTTANSKEAALLLAAHDIVLRGVADDVVLQAYLLDPAASVYHPLELALAAGLDVAPAQEDAQLAQETSLYLPLAVIQNRKLQEMEMQPLYRETELPLAMVLAGMEQTGVRVDGETLHNFGVELEKHIRALEKEIHSLAGVEFNINSTKQLGEILFEKMGIPPLKKTKTGYSTDSAVLEQLAGEYEIAAKVLDYRTYAKLKSTYADGLFALINPRTGKIHTSYKQTVTATGRLSSVEPNLQNIPIRLELGRQLRRAFIPDQPENLLIAGDYNQIELRVLAHISGDEKLCQAFLDGEDIHARTAAEVFGVPIDQVDATMRRAAKAVNFGIVYGISDYGLSTNLSISRARAKEYIERYFLRYPKVAEYQRITVVEARKRGFVSTLLGRRRYLPELASSNFNVRSFGQRMAINTPIQGSAADIIKLAMLALAAEIEKRGLQTRMILQVHDELIFDVPPAERQIMLELIPKQMENALPLSVPLTVDLKEGPDWYNMKEIERKA